MQLKYFEIEVTGKGVFPYDMLRYGQLFPCNTTDAHNLEPDVREKRTVKLGCYSRNAGMIIGTMERFRSFLWAAQIIKV